MWANIVDVYLHKIPEAGSQSIGKQKGAHGLCILALGSYYLLERRMEAQTRFC